MESIFQNTALIELLLKTEKINFELEYAEGESYSAIRRKRWEEIQEISDENERAKAEKAFVEDCNVSLDSKITIIVQYLCKIAKSENTPLCSFEDVAYCYNGSCWESIDPVELNKFLSHVAVFTGLNQTIAYAARTVNKLVEQFHSYTSRVESHGTGRGIAINLANGTLKINDDGWVLQPFSHHDFFRYQLPVAYVPDATAPLFQTFLDRVLPEKESQDFLAEYIGYSLTNHLKLEQCLVLIGTGANGKSVVFDIVNALLGSENITCYSLIHLCKERGYHRAQLSGKLLNYSSELGTGSSDVDMLKKLISNEPIEARNPYGKPFTLYNYGKFMFNTNSLPTSVEISDAYFRRMNFMQFEVTIPKSEQDPELAQKIIATELDGILQWMLAGLKRLLQNRKFTHSPKMETAKERIRRDLDSVATFMDEEGYRPSSGERIPLKEIREKYNEFCKLNNFHPVGHRIFGQRLRAIGFDIQSGTGNVTYVYCEILQKPAVDEIGEMLDKFSVK